MAAAQKCISNDAIFDIFPRLPRKLFSLQEKLITKEYSMIRFNIGALFSLLSLVALPVQAQGDASFDGLVKVEDAAMAMAYIDPDADFSVFKRVMILRPSVAFVSNWQRDQNRGRGRNITIEDMERIKKEAADLLREVFAESLEAAGYAIATAPDYDVLLLRPAIINLNIAAPDKGDTSINRTYIATTSSGSATIYLELFDSVSGDIIARGAEATAARNTSDALSWNRESVNRTEAKRIFSGWAKFLVDFLDSYYVNESGTETAE